MGPNSAQQEIISTPEAKGMRLPPTARGVNVELSSLQNRRESVEMRSERHRIGQLERDLHHARQKSEARSSSEVARPLQLLQVDPKTDDRLTPKSLLSLPKEFAGLDEPHTAPSNCSIAAGPAHLIVSVNSSFAVIEKSGRQLLRSNLADLFFGLAGDAFIFSPKAIYDHFRDRWAIAACACSIDRQHSWFLLAYSHSGNPLGDWWIWMLDASTSGGIKTGHVADCLGLSVDNNSLYLTANLYGGQGQFLYSKFRVLGQKELQTGGVLHGWDFWDLRNVDGTAAFCLQPALNLRPAGVQYLLNATDDGQGLTLWSFMTPQRQDPVLSRRFIPTVRYQLAPNAKQPPTKVAIETGDTRLGDVIFRHGMLWTAHTIAANWGENENVAAIQWFQINPRAGYIIHQGIYGAPHFNYFSPAMMADGEGNVTLVFNRCGETEQPSLRFTGRRPSDEMNALGPSLLLQQGGGTESAEWLQFSSASIAPEDRAVWIIGQYAATRQDWATWIGAVTFTEIEAQQRDFFGQRLDTDPTLA